MADCLFEFQNSSRVFVINTRLCEELSRHMNYIGFENAKVCVSGPELTEKSSEDEKPKKHLFVLQKWSKKWNTYVEVPSVEEITPDSKITVKDTSPAIEVKSGTSYVGAAKQYCQKMRDVPESSASALKKLFPSCSASKGKRKFNPLDECIIAETKKKKKSTNTRIKPREIPVVYLPKKTPFIPKGYARNQLSLKGCIHRIQFRRNMSAEEVKSTIIHAFSSIKVKEYAYLRSGQDNRLLVVEDDRLSGDQIFELAGQGSIYLYDPEEAKADSPEQVISVDDGKNDTEPIVINSESDECEEKKQQQERLSFWDPDEFLEDPLYWGEALYPSNFKSSDLLEEDRALCQMQNKAYEESLAIDKEKAKQMEQAQAITKRIDSVRSDCVQLFGSNQPENIKGSLKIAFKESGGKKMEHIFNETSVVKDLYRFVFAQGIPPPFLLSVAIPRTTLPLLSDGQKLLASLNLNESVLMVERIDDGTEEFINAIDLQMPNVSSLSCHSNNHADQSTESLKEDLQTLEIERMKYMMELTTSPFSCAINRETIFEQVVDIYREERIAESGYPLFVEYKGEKAVDIGGVTRDLYSAFWDKCYAKMFDGCGLLVPIISPQTDTPILPIIGKIISHGYLACGFLPIRVSLPCLIGILCGPCISIPSVYVLEAFLDYISGTERTTLRDALEVCSTETTFSPDLKGKLLSTLARYGCRSMPSPKNLKVLLLQVAQFEFITKPAAAIALMQSGVPAVHSSFWQQRSSEGIFNIYKTLSISSSKVLDIIELPDAMNAAEERVSGYLVDLIGNMSCDHLQCFLRFVTGSSVITVPHIEVQFNRLDGLGRRPIAHTCECMLELPVSYVNYCDFHSEWMSIISATDDFSWIMDSI